MFSSSVDLSPVALDEGGGLEAVLRGARLGQGDGWLRGVGYDVVASGPLDAARLERSDAGPVRVQDRTGIQWVLDPAALATVLPPEPASWPSGEASKRTAWPTSSRPAPERN